MILPQARRESLDDRDFTSERFSYGAKEPFGLSLLCNMRDTMLPPIQLSLNGRNPVFMLFVFQFARAANVW